MSRLLIIINLFVACILTLQVYAAEGILFDYKFTGTINIELKTPIVCLKDQPEHEDTVRKTIASYLHRDEKEIKQLSTKCKEATYQHEKTKIVVEVDIEDGHYVTLILKPVAETADRIECFKQALYLIKKHSIISADKTIKEFQRRFPKKFNSPKEGPAQWVDCLKEDMIDSIPTLVHETIHRLRKEGPENIVYFRPEGPLLQMTGNIQLFVDAESKMKKTASNGRNGKEIIDAIIAPYRDFSFAEILDEVNAYTTSEKVVFYLLQNDLGKLYKRRDRGLTSVNIFILPIMLTLAEHQANIIKEDAPHLWADTLNQPSQKGAVNIMWRDGVELSNQIYKYIKEHHLPMTQIEENFFKHIQNLREKMLI